MFHGVFLAFSNASGERLLSPIQQRKFCLPLETPVETIKLDEDEGSGYFIEIDAGSQTATLSAFDSHCTILGNHSFHYHLPASSQTHNYTVILREGDHILNSVGRWEVLWEDKHGSIHNSMRAPALPVPFVSSDALQSLETDPAPLLDDQHISTTDTPATDDSSGMTDFVAFRSSATAKVEGETNLPPPSMQVPTADPAESTSQPRSWPAVNSPDALAHTVASSPILPTNSPDSDPSPTAVEPHNMLDDDNYKLSQPSTSSDNSFQVAGSSKIIPESLPWRKRSNKECGDIDTAKRVRFTQRSEELRSDTERTPEKDEEEEGNTITVIPRRNSPVKSISRSRKKRCQSLRLSPARDTTPDINEPDEWRPTVYMAGTTTIDQGHEKIMRSFRELGGAITKNVIQADILCVGKDKPLMKSGSLLLAIASGIPIVTEDWIIDATRRDAFPDTARYLPRDPERERLWGFKLSEAVLRGSKGLTHLLSGKKVYLATCLLKAINTKAAVELSKLATALGADDVKRYSPSKKCVKDAADLSTIIVLGEQGSPELHELGRRGLNVYAKDLLTTAALRGKLQYNQYTIAASVKREDD